MKWVWIILGALVVVIGAVVACGAMLPVAHVASRQVRFRKTPDAVWAAIAREKTFREGDVNYEVTESVAPRRMVTRIADKNLPFGGQWTYELSPDGAGSALRITENGET
jgi:hypothetical protein